MGECPPAAPWNRPRRPADIALAQMQETMNPKNRHLNEYLKGAAKIRKLAELLRKLRTGDSLAGAAAAATVSKKELNQLLDVIEDELARRLPKEPSRRAQCAPGEIAHAQLYSDGASRGNPGRAACAAVLCDEGGDEILTRAELLGVATNNVAEYEGVLLGLRLARDLRVPSVALRLDSELVVRQLQGVYKVKHPALRPLHEQAKILLSGFAKVSIEHIPRAENARADELANAALDGTAEP